MFGAIIAEYSSLPIKATAASTTIDRITTTQAQISKNAAKLPSGEHSL